MGTKKNDILQGTLILLVLKTLASGGRMHGYAITRTYSTYFRPVVACRGRLPLPRSAPHRTGSWVRAEWGKTEKNREGTLLYTITAKGRAQLAEEQKSWSRLTEGVARVMRGTVRAEAK